MVTDHFVDEHDFDDADDGDLREMLGLARVRYLVSLVMLPYVSRYLGNIRDLIAVVDDVTEHLGRAQKPGASTDLGAFFRAYIQKVEHPLRRCRYKRLDVEWVWTYHAMSIRERLNRRGKDSKHND